jgi:hypothetical protein
VPISTLLQCTSFLSFEQMPTRNFSAGSAQQLSALRVSLLRCYTACITAQGGRLSQDVCWAILGHEEKMVAAGYGEGFPLKMLREWIDKIGF